MSSSDFWRRENYFVKNSEGFVLYIYLERTCNAFLNQSPVKPYLGLVYSGVPQVFPWRINPLQSLAPTLIKLLYLWLSNDPEDSD